jgi:membrane dipeptidase
VGLLIATLLARLHRPGMMPAFQRATTIWMRPTARPWANLPDYQALTEQGYLRWIKDAAGLKAHVADWLAGKDVPLGFILSMEGADPDPIPNRSRRGGMSACGLSARLTTASAPTHTAPEPSAVSFPQGPILLRRDATGGMILDVTHLSDQCFDEAIDPGAGRCSPAIIIVVPWCQTNGN